MPVLLRSVMGRPNQPRDRRGRWTETGAGARLGSQRHEFAKALQHQGRAGDNSGRSTVYAYLRDRDSPSGKAGSPYYVGVAGNTRRPYEPHRRTPVPSDERRIRMLRSNVTHEQAREWEKYYIEKFGRKDVGTGRKMLINHTDGGDGVANLPAKARAKLAAANRGRVISPETRAKISAVNRGKTVSPETRAKIGAANRNASPETRAKKAAAARGRTHSPEARAKIAAAARNRSPEHRAKIGAASRNRSPETRAKMAAAARNRSPEANARMAATKTRDTAARHGVDPNLWSSMSVSLRSSSVTNAKKQGLTVAQYIEKMRSKWGV